jgi:DNA-binding NarL/FixJ family response regulator
MAQKIPSTETPGKTWVGRSVISEEITILDIRAGYITARLAWLTRRELEVLQLVAAGLSNAEIANRLMITSATIISYLNSIYGKLGVRSRTAAMRYAIDHRLC